MASANAHHHASSAHKASRILACVLCQHRKIKCDRTFPCSNCTKANVRCTPSTPAPARKRRRPNQDLQERLARCEDLLKEYASTDKPEVVPAPPAAATYVDPYKQFHAPFQTTGKLVKEDGDYRFMDSLVLSTIYDELKAMRQIIDTDEPEESTPDSSTPDDNADLLLGGDSPATAIEDLWPDASHVFRLWQTYLDRINPLTKIIHVPTLQPYVVEATGGSQTLPKNVEALLFSVFLMGVVALEPKECQSMLGYSRDEALQRFSSGIRISLMRIGFLKTHDLTTLQALVIYLISLQGRYNRHSAWILNGIVIRIAQKMGLHRDGELLGLKPFEAEMRRRLWWSIIMVDAKYAMLTGLSHSLLPRSWDTKEPKNLNDADLFPSATEPLQDHEGPTEMVFCLMQYKIARFLVESPGLEIMTICADIGNPDMANSPQLALFRKAIEKLAADLCEVLDKHCDPSAGPVHEMAVQMRKQILYKFNQLIMPPKAAPEWGIEVHGPKDNAFRLAVSQIEHSEQSYNVTVDKGFLWFSKMHFQVDLFVYMVGQLCHRTEGSLVERAWHQVGIVYHYFPELATVDNKAAHTLSQYALIAWKKREVVLRDRNGGQLPEVPNYIEKIRASMQHGSDGKSSLSDQSPALQTYSSSSSLSNQEGSKPSNNDIVLTPSTPDDPSLDQFLGGYLDVSSLDWDMFGTLPTIPQQNMTQQFAGFGMGPTAEWS